MIDCCGIGPFAWDRVKDMAQIECQACGKMYYIPQCCENEQCGGDCQ